MVDGLDCGQFDGASGFVGIAQHRSLGGVPHRPKANSFVRRLLHGGCLPFSIQAQQILHAVQRGFGAGTVALPKPRAETLCHGLLGGHTICGVGLWIGPAPLAKPMVLTRLLLRHLYLRLSRSANMGLFLAADATAHLPFVYLFNNPRAGGSFLAFC